MRAPEDMPRRRRGRGRAAVGSSCSSRRPCCSCCFTSLRGLAGFYTDYLWFDSLDLTQVWSGVLWSKIFLGAFFTLVFFVFCFVNLTVADRLAPEVPADRSRGRSAQPLPRGRRPPSRVGAWGGVAAVRSDRRGRRVGQWNQWILFRNGGDFGMKDATFGTDVGFYVFKLPVHHGGRSSGCSRRSSSSC